MPTACSSRTHQIVREKLRRANGQSRVSHSLNILPRHSHAVLLCHSLPHYLTHSAPSLLPSWLANRWQWNRSKRDRRKPVGSVTGWRLSEDPVSGLQ